MTVAETTSHITEVVTRLLRFVIEERDAALKEAARLRDENTRLEEELNELRWEDAGKWNGTRR